MTVVAGVVVSILSFNFTQNRELDVRAAEAKKYQAQRNDELERRRTEAAKPFLEMRQQKYMEAIKVAGVLASPAGRAATEIAAARVKFPADRKSRLWHVIRNSVCGIKTVSDIGRIIYPDFFPVPLWSIFVEIVLCRDEMLRVVKEFSVCRIPDAGSGSAYRPTMVEITVRFAVSINCPGSYQFVIFGFLYAGIEVLLRCLGSLRQATTIASAKWWKVDRGMEKYRHGCVRHLFSRELAVEVV
jgi:hypothetical protein